MFKKKMETIIHRYKEVPGDMMVEGIYHNKKKKREFRFKKGNYIPHQFNDKRISKLRVS
jgi:hypothetical protein